MKFDRFHNFIVASFIAVLILGLTVCMGWYFDLKILTSVIPNYPTMKFNTALGFIMAGASSLCFLKSKRISIFIAVFLMVLGLLSALQDILNQNLGIDDFFFSSTLQEGIKPASRMSFITAMCFLLVGWALILLNSRKKQIIQTAQGLLNLVTLFAFIAVTGFIFQVPTFYKLSLIASMAVHTSIAFLVLSIALSLINSKFGLISMFIGNQIGNNMARRVFIQMTVSIMILGFTWIQAHKISNISVEFGITLLIVTFVTLFTFLLFQITAAINRLEFKNTLAEKNLNRNKIFIQQAPGAIAMLDNQMQYITASSQWLSDYGLNENNYVGISHYDLFPEIGDDWKQIHNECLKGSINQSDGTLFERNDGTVQWISWDVRPWFKNDDEIGGLIMYTSDITEKKQHEEVLNKKNQELNAILNTESVSIVGTDVSGLITHFNKGAELHLQYSAKEMIGKQSPGIFHVEEEIIQRGKELTEQFGRPIEGFNAFVEMARQGESESREWTYVRKDGSRFPVQLIVTALRNVNSEITGFLGVAADLTERKEAESKQRNISILESKSKEMEQFAYIASHDLREPLLTIKNFLGLLLKNEAERISTSGVKYANLTIDAASRMEALISGLLDYSRLSRVKTLEVVNSREVIDGLTSDLNALFESNNVVLNTGDLPTIKAYPMEFKVIFQNLIQNAVKFKQPDVDPVISIGAEKIDGGWKFFVKDNGIGIEEQHREKVFVIFRRLHHRSEYEGTGLGLANAKKIVELHNGRIWIESNKGQGSIFYFTIETEHE